MSLKLPRLNNFKRLDLESIIDLNEDDSHLIIKDAKKNHNITSEKPTKLSSNMTSNRTAHLNYNLQNPRASPNPNELATPTSELTQNLRLTPNDLTKIFSHYPKPLIHDDQNPIGYNTDLPSSIMSSKKYYLPSISIYSIPKLKPLNFLPTNKLGQNKKIKNLREFLGGVSSKKRDASPIIVSPTGYVTNMNVKNESYHMNRGKMSFEEDYSRRTPLVRILKIENVLDEFADFHINND